MTLPAELAVEPLGHPVDADVTPPGSKSLTNRALVAAALAQGRSVLEGALHADDTEAMVGCLAGLGVADPGRLGRRPAHRRRCRGRPSSRRATPSSTRGMSGTTARFVAPLLGLGRRERRLTGHPQLLARPMGPVVDALRGLGVEVVEEGEPGHLPVLVRAAGGIRGGRIALPGHVSSQFLSGLLLAGPAMDDGLEVELTSELVSRPYVALTVATMRHFGVEVDIGPDGRTFAVRPGRYRAGEHRIEPDATAASYFLAAAAVCGGRVRIAGLGSASVQGDVGFAALLGSMGASVEQGTDWTELRSSGSLRGVTVDLADLSDTAPDARRRRRLRATTPTRVTGIGFIRKKESDRIGAVVARAPALRGRRRRGGRRVRRATGSGRAARRPHRDLRRPPHGDELRRARASRAGRRRSSTRPAWPRPSRASSRRSTRSDSFGSRMELRVIAIDGPAGSGKSTVARAVADALGLEYLDTGAMYRSVTFAALRSDVDPADTDAVGELAAGLEIDVDNGVVTVDGVDATIEIRGPEVTRAVSTVAANPAVRTELVSRQREWARRRGGGVIEGRDIGSVVFPDAAPQGVPDRRRRTPAPGEGPRR